MALCLLGFLNCAKKLEIAERFVNQKLILLLAYLADVISHLTELNTAIHGKEMNMIIARQKISAFTNKLSI